MRRETISLTPGSDGWLGIGSGGLVVADLKAGSAALRASFGRRGRSALIWCAPGVAASLCLDAAFLDDLSPFLHLADHEGTERFRAHAHHFGALGFEAFLRIG